MVLGMRIKKNINFALIFILIWVFLLLYPARLIASNLRPPLILNSLGEKDAAQEECEIIVKQIVRIRHDLMNSLGVLSSLLSTVTIADTENGPIVKVCQQMQDVCDQLKYYSSLIRSGDGNLEENIALFRAVSKDLINILTPKTIRLSNDRMYKICKKELNESESDAANAGWLLENMCKAVRLILMSTLNKGELEKRVIYINEYLDMALANEIGRYSYRDVKVQKEYGAGDISVFGIESEIFRILINIIRNAREAMDTGGEITVRTILAGDNIEISITNTGPEMPEAKVNAFNAGEAVISSKEGSKRGFGLRIVKELASINNGKVKVTSESGKGTTFIIILPVFKEQELKDIPRSQKSMLAAI